MLSSTPAIPRVGGMLDFNCMGVAGCTRCGWRGVATDTFCPVCEVRPQVEAEWAAISGAVKVPRNQPCPCGSGKKAKRCCHA